MNDVPPRFIEELLLFGAVSNTTLPEKKEKMYAYVRGHEFVASIVCALDGPRVRESLGARGAGKLCDGVFVGFRNNGGPVHIALVELKGSHFDDAVTQLQQGVDVLQAALAGSAWDGNYKMVAVVVSKHAPTDVNARKKKFAEDNGNKVALRHKETDAENRADLTAIVLGRDGFAP